MKSKKAKKEKKIKLTPIPKINRKLFKLWSEKVRERANKKCEYCGIAIGEIGKNGKPINKLDSHHLVSRIKKNSFLKWDLNNGVCVCSGCHKFSEDSFHRSPITTIAWLIKNHPERFDYVVSNFNVKIDLENRLVLQEIESKLLEGKPLDLEILKKLDQEYALTKTTTPTTTTSTTTEATFSV